MIRFNYHSEKLEVAALIITPAGSKRMIRRIDVRVKRMIKKGSESFSSFSSSAGYSSSESLDLILAAYSVT